MKPSSLRLAILGLLVLNLVVGLEAGLFLTRNGVISCKLSTRRTCDKITRYCVKITTPSTCKLYKNECQFLIDKCLMKSQFGLTGTMTAIADCKNIPVGTTVTC